jgi:RNA polymerase sigma factor (sigma-70 family)
MATSQMSQVIQHLRSSMLRHDGAGVTDGQLLGYFVEQRDEAAFAALMRRHGPMVMGVCRRALRNPHDAEDAFQATFLVLVRKAASIMPRERVASWLHGVARTTALRTRVLHTRRSRKERQVVELPEPEAPGQDLWRDLKPLLDQELSGLPEKYRLPILLCDLEGKSIKEATRQLGWLQGTLAGRLVRARDLLAKRLARYRLVVSGGALATLLSQQAAPACVPTLLTPATIQAGAISASVVALTEGVLKTMLVNKLKAVLAGLVLLGAVAFGAGFLAHRPAAAQQGKPRAEVPTPERPSTNIVSVPISPQDYGKLFEKVLQALGVYFSEFEYANRYDGWIETRAVVDRGTTPLLRRRAIARIIVREEGGYFVDVKVFKEKMTDDTTATLDTVWERVGRDTEWEQTILKRLVAQTARARQDSEKPAPRKAPPAVRQVRQYQVDLTLVQADPDGRDFGKEGKGKVLAEPKLITLEGQEGTFLSGGNLAVLGGELDFGLLFRVKVFSLGDGWVRLETLLEKSEADQSDKNITQVSGKIIRSIARVKLGETVKLVLKDDQGLPQHWLKVRVAMEETSIIQTQTRGPE